MKFENLKITEAEFDQLAEKKMLVITKLKVVTKYGPVHMLVVH